LPLDLAIGDCGNYRFFAFLALAAFFAFFAIGLIPPFRLGCVRKVNRDIAVASAAWHSARAFRILPALLRASA
jgi:hypothetical protein